MTEREQCSGCGSVRVRYDQTYGFYNCQNCGNVWAYPEDDPDYDEVDEEGLEVSRRKLMLAWLGADVSFGVTDKEDGIA